MTIDEAIRLLDQQKHNTCSREEKLRWLTELDGLATLLLGGGDLPKYDLSTHGGTELKIYPPFQEAYLYYLEGKIDYQNGDITRFNNANAMFFSLFQRFTAHAHRVGQQAVKNQFF